MKEYECLGLPSLRIYKPILNKVTRAPKLRHIFILVLAKLAMSHLLMAYHFPPQVIPTGCHPPLKHIYRNPQDHFALARHHGLQSIYDYELVKHRHTLWNELKTLVIFRL